jgi:hypothetical protein
VAVEIGISGRDYTKIFGRDERYVAMYPGNSKTKIDTRDCHRIFANSSVILRQIGRPDIASKSSRHKPHRHHLRQIATDIAKITAIFYNALLPIIHGVTTVAIN